jgi:hypothetical protein
MGVKGALLPKTRASLRVMSNGTAHPRRRLSFKWSGMRWDTHGPDATITMRGWGPERTIR